MLKLSPTHPLVFVYSGCCHVFMCDYDDNAGVLLIDHFELRGDNWMLLAHRP